MNRERISHLIPCYLCGDLPPELMEQVRQALAQHPDLQVTVQQMDAARQRCAALVQASAPAEATQALSPSRPRQVFPAVGVVLVVAIVLVGLVGLWFGIARPGWPPRAPVAEGQSAPLAPPLQPYALALAQAVGGKPLPFVTSDPSALQAMFLGAGLSPGLAMVNDYRFLGWTLVGGQTEGGVASAVWRDAQGRLILCQMGPEIAIGADPVQVVKADVSPRPDLLLYALPLQGLESGAPPLSGQTGAAVVWFEQGMLCTLTAIMPGDALIETAKRAIWKV